MLSHQEAMIRITVATVLGAAIGYERNVHRRPVGLRTHMIVALASSLFMIVSSEFTYYQHFEKGGLIEVDASRIAASVVSAVGFLGGGAILRTGPVVQGVTTAAGLWLVTAIGMASGAGMFVEAVFAATLGLLALSVLRKLESKGQRLHGTITMHAGEDAAAQVSELARHLESTGARVTQVELRKPQHKAPRTVVEFDLTQPERLELDALVGDLERRTGVQRVTIQRRN